MKKFLFFLAVLNFSFASSQCTIDGADQLQVGERQVYKATTAAAPCENCYEWIYLDQKVLLENGTHQSEITLKGAVPGEAVLNLELKTKNGKTKCKKMVKVIAPTSNILPGDSAKCDLPVEAFKEIRAGDHQVVFEPETSDTNYTYLWTVTYRDGSQKTSSDRKARFSYMGSVIDNVEMKVTFEKCTKKISKNYDTNFWYFF